MGVEGAAAVEVGLALLLRGGLLQWWCVELDGAVQAEAPDMVPTRAVVGCGCCCDNGVVKGALEGAVAAEAPDGSPTRAVVCCCCCCCAGAVEVGE